MATAFATIADGVRLPAAFTYRDHQLHCEQAPLQQVADRFGTPSYIYSETAIRNGYRSFRRTFREVEPQICYAVKANSNLSVLRILKEEGSGFDIVSIGELFRLDRIGADPERTVFSGVGKRAEELLAALDRPIGCLNLESLQELEVVCRLAELRHQTVRVSFRFNPDVSADTHPYIATGMQQHKFGIETCQAAQAAAIVNRTPQIQAIGVGCHIGSQILETGPFIEAFRCMRDLADKLRRLGLPIEQLDLGGGFGVSYRGEARPELASLAEVLTRERGDYRILFEPGRRIVAEAGILLTRVLYRKVSNGKHFVIVDGAMNDLMRPSLYQAHHEIVPVCESEAVVEADVVGPVCESGDFFARGRLVADLQPGDLTAVLHAGAYGFTLSSNYNSRPRPAEVMVCGDVVRLARRRESMEDLVAQEW